MLAGCVSAKPIGPVALTFEKADVRISRNVVKKYKLNLPAAYTRARAAAKNDAWPNIYKARLEELAAKVPVGVKLPVIVYFHGCAGFLSASGMHMNWLERLDDFITIGPNSFARTRPAYCFGDYTVDESIWSLVSSMRMAEIDYALDRLAALPWVDLGNIFLMGHSQGGGTVAGYDGPVKVRGRIMLNGACSWRIGGNGAASDEALLTFDTGRDPWFRVYDSRCREYVLNHPNGKSVYDMKSMSHNLVLQHWPKVREFLKKNLH